MRKTMEILLSLKSHLKLRFEQGAFGIQGRFSNLD
jgi:hypothetical protein